MPEEEKSPAFVPLDEDPYAKHRNHPIRFMYGPEHYFGIYQGCTTKNQLIIQPHLSLSVPSETGYACYTWSADPISINFYQGFPMSMVPQTQEYLESLVKQSQMHAEKILAKERDKRHPSAAI